VTGDGISVRSSTREPDTGESFSKDGFLGGRLAILQPKSGHRAGLDAILLAAACPAQGRQTIADFGAGVGVAGLAVLARQPDCRITLIEQDAALIALSVENARANEAASRVRALEVRIGRPGGAEAAGLAPGSLDHVIANPPFAAPEAGQHSPDAKKRTAHQIGKEGLEPWFRWAAGSLKDGGTFTLIHEPWALPHLLMLCPNRFGAISVLPVLPRTHEPASRILLQGIKGSHAALSIAPPLVLHGETGSGYTPQAEDILRNAASLPISRRHA
jgi:tRNA1(Val) A37 N6-methylase TrmN6